MQTLLCTFFLSFDQFFIFQRQHVLCFFFRFCLIKPHIPLKLTLNFIHDFIDIMIEIIHSMIMKSLKHLMNDIRQY